MIELGKLDKTLYPARSVAFVVVYVGQSPKINKIEKSLVYRISIENPSFTHKEKLRLPDIENQEKINFRIKVKSESDTCE